MDNHWAATVTSSAFKGKTRVRSTSNGRRRIERAIWAGYERLAVDDRGGERLTPQLTIGGFPETARSAVGGKLHEPPIHRRASARHHQVGWPGQSPAVW